MSHHHEEDNSSSLLDRSTSCDNHQTTTPTTTMQARKVVPSLGPAPTLVSRKEMDMLYRLLGAVTLALDTLGVDYIVTGGSLLGAIRQASILFCDDDVDISILDPYYTTNNNAQDSDYDDDDDEGRSIYWTRVVPFLQQTLGKDFRCKRAAWEGGDRVYWGHSNVFLDLFVIRKYTSLQALEAVLAVKANGQAQSPEYVTGIIDTVTKAAKHIGDASQTQAVSALEPPFWHFARRKAVELWPKEVYRDWELWPLYQNLQMGPHGDIKGPRLPVLLLKRAFGDDCLSVYYPSVQHGGNNKSSAKIANDNKTSSSATTTTTTTIHLPPKVLPGGTWQHAAKMPLQDEHFIPIQPTPKADRRPNHHCRIALLEYLVKQVVWEERTVQQELTKERSRPKNGNRPRRTVYMDGVFDLFHVGHLAAIRQCAIRGDRVIIGVTGDKDATSYKRRPIISQEERCTLVAAIAEVDQVVCPCPLIVTEAFMHEMGIDLVVHGFVNDEDADRQAEFFAYPMRAGKFERIPYYHGQSTTDIMHNIKTSPAL